MSEKVTVAVQSMKAAQTEMVQWENRVDALKQTNENLAKQKEVLEADLARKRMDFDMYIGSKDAELKKLRADLTEDQQNHSAMKLEFIEAMKKFRQDQIILEAAKKDVENEKAKLMDSRSKIDQFVISLQRAYTLIGG